MYTLIFSPKIFIIIVWFILNVDFHQKLFLVFGFDSSMGSKKTSDRLKNSQNWPALY